MSNAETMRVFGIHVVRLLEAAVVVALLVLPASAEYIPPGELVVKTEAYSPQTRQLPVGTYLYDITWQGIPVGSAEIKVAEGIEQGVPAYVVEASARSAKGIDLFYRLRHRTVSVFQAGSMRPIRFLSDQKENRSSKTTEVIFGQDGSIHASVKKKNKPVETTKFHSDNLTLDPVTAAFLARSLTVEVGSRMEFDVFNGKHRYLIALSVEEREDHEVNGRLLKALRVVPIVKKLTDTKGETKLRSAALWVSDDDKRDVLSLESRVWIGSVSARLASFTPVMNQAAREAAPLPPLAQR